MITVKSVGNFSDTISFLNQAMKLDILEILKAYGAEGVAALSTATPHHTGLAAGDWSYEVGEDNGVYFIYWKNSDVESDFPVAIMLQYGYATGTGGYIEGRDYINPAMKPIFDEIAEKVQKAVTSIR